MKKMLKIVKIICWILAVTGTGLLLGFIETEQYDRTIKRVFINIDYGGADVMVTVANIDSIVRRSNGELRGKSLVSVNTGKIVDAILREPFVELVNVYENNEGYLFIDVWQRKPVLRIINQKFESFYIDGSGKLLPVKPGYPAHVLVANGFIPDSFLKNRFRRITLPPPSYPVVPDSVMTGLLRLALFLSNDPYFKTAIDQVFVNGQHEFELIPKKGDQVVFLGDACNLEEKFGKLQIFYDQGLNQIGWNKYHFINIKYTNQVVCSKL